MSEKFAKFNYYHHSPASTQKPTEIDIFQKLLKARGEPTVYHVGDTDIFSDMALINEIHQLRVALVPVGDRFTMGGKIAGMAVKRFFKGLKTAIPCHYGSFPIIEQTPDKFVAEMKGSEVKVVVPEKNTAFEV